MTKASHVSLRTRWLGEMLRQARNKTDCTLRDAADYVGIDLSSLGRFERGTHRIRKSYLRDLINLYGISDPNIRDMLLRINEDSWKRDWWDGDTHDLEAGFIDYAWLEHRATAIRHFAMAQIPGLLQTRAYAEAIMRQSQAHEKRGDIDSLVELRMKRQSVIDGPNPTQLSVVLDESVLSRAVGQDAVTQEQFQYLCERMRCPHIDIRVRNANAKWTPALGVPFAFFLMQDPYPDVAYVENLSGRTFMEDQEKTAPFQRAYDELHASSRSARDTARLLESLTKEST